MFLQGGGPPAPMAAAPMAAPNAAPNAGAGAGIPPELQMALAGAEQEGSAIGQGIGQKFVTDMMDGLDGAEDYEQIINAIRGNELPLSARYDELGEIVGEEDASGTPESVLALTQPAIMMTEEGAMNSGIGELMQNLTGDVSMEGGMESGVGSLMAAGQPAEPPMGPGPDPTALGPTLNGTPQGFAVGGAVNRFRNSPVVQNFQAGGLSSLADLYKVQPTSAYYQQNLAELEDVIDTDEQTNLAKSRILFDIASRAAAWAGGVNPETGQRMTGSPFSQFATAASGLPKTIGEQMAAVQAQKQKLKLAAYQGAQTQRAAAIERATKTFKMGPGDVLLDVRGQEIAKADPKRITPAWHQTQWRGPKGKLLFSEPHDANLKGDMKEKHDAFLKINPEYIKGRTYKLGTLPAPTKPLAVQESRKITVRSKSGNADKATVIIPSRTTELGHNNVIKWIRKNVPGYKDIKVDDINYDVTKLPTGEDIGKLTPSALTKIGTDPVNIRLYANPGPAFKLATSRDDRDELRQSLNETEAALHQMIKPYVDEKGVNRAATGLSAEGEAALRNRLRLLDELDKNDVNYERDKKLLTVSSRLKAHVDRLDAVSLSKVEVARIKSELKDLKEDSIDVKTKIHPSIFNFDFSAISGGLPGWAKKAIGTVAGIVQYDAFPKSKEARGLFNVLTNQSTKVLSQLNRVSPTRETQRTYDDIKALTPIPGSATVTLEDLVRRAVEMKITFQDSLADALRRNELATQQNDPIEVLKSLEEAKTLRRLLFTWVYVENSLRGKTSIPLSTKEGSKAVEDVYGRKK